MDHWQNDKASPRPMSCAAIELRCTPWKAKTRDQFYKPCQILYRNRSNIKQARKSFMCLGIRDHQRKSSNVQLMLKQKLHNRAQESKTHTKNFTCTKMRNINTYMAVNKCSSCSYKLGELDYGFLFSGGFLLFVAINSYF